MGISSNQARFLTLTGRKCDIEYRMQNICQRRLAIANETQRASQLYNDAMSNRKLFINEMSAGSQFGGLTQGDDLSTVAELTAELLNKNGYYIVDTDNPDSTNIIYEYKTATSVQIQGGGASSFGDDSPTDGSVKVTINNIAYGVGSKLENGDYLLIPPSYEGGENKFEEYLRSGRYKLVREADVYTQNPTNLGGKNYEFVDWRNVPIISDALDTSDDAEAQTNYDRTIRDLNEQDKILEMEMQKLDTEYTAVNAERDSLTKILDTNVKGSFKYFS